MNIFSLAERAGFVVNPVGQIVVPAPGCDARPQLERLVEILKQRIMVKVWHEDCFTDDWDRGYNAGARQAAGQLVLDPCHKHKGDSK